MDRIDYVLSPDDGLLGVVDFYTAGKQPSLHEKAIGGTSKECGWLSRWFWQIWFDFDHVSLSPDRRDYLQYRFGTVSVQTLILYILPLTRATIPGEKLQRAKPIRLAFHSANVSSHHNSLLPRK